MGSRCGALSPGANPLTVGRPAQEPLRGEAGGMERELARGVEACAPWSQPAADDVLPGGDRLREAGVPVAALRRPVPEVYHARHVWREEPLCRRRRASRCRRDTVRRWAEAHPARAPSSSLRSRPRSASPAYTRRRDAERVDVASATEAASRRPTSIEAAAAQTRSGRGGNAPGSRVTNRSRPS
jgi:hypothetical protein